MRIELEKIIFDLYLLILNSNEKNIGKADMSMGYKPHVTLGWVSYSAVLIKTDAGILGMVAQKI